jgi:proteasome accessory factor B
MAARRSADATGASGASGASGAVRARVPVERRQFNLVLALVATTQGLTKHELLSTVHGYAERYAVAADRDNLERQFERDKDDLRDLGVPLETVAPPGAEDDTKQQRYRIAKERYQLPEDVEFSAEEYALLTLAGQVWREGSLSEHSRRALVKLRSFGLSVDAQELGFAPSIGTRDPAYDPLAAAIDRGRQVSFPYLKAGHGEPERRRVSPLALVNHEGRWHLQAHDELADGPRTFLLRRIVGAVRIEDAPARPAAPDEAARAAAELQRVWERTTALVRTTSGSEADVVLRNRAGTEVEPIAGGEGAEALRIRTTDLDVLADELAAFGAGVRVLEPANLRTAVLDRWRAVAVAHG